MKENQRIAVTKRMLKEGLLRLLQTRELKKIHINELCQEAGVNRSTFYRHYKTPLDVLSELEQDIARQMFPHYDAPPRDVQEAQQRLEKTCTFIYNNAELMKTLFRCNAEGDIMRLAGEFYMDYHALRKKDKPFADMDEHTARSVACFLFNGCYYMLRQWILEDIPKTPREIAAILSELIRKPASGELSAGKV